MHRSWHITRFRNEIQYAVLLNGKLFKDTGFLQKFNFHQGYGWLKSCFTPVSSDSQYQCKSKGTDEECWVCDLICPQISQRGEITVVEMEAGCLQWAPLTWAWDTEPVKMIRPTTWKEHSYHLKGPSHIHSRREDPKRYWFQRHWWTVSLTWLLHQSTHKEPL